MPEVGVPELLIILVIVILVFGVGKLPQIGSALGQSIREFRHANRELKNAAEGEEPEATDAKRAGDAAHQLKET